MSRQGGRARSRGGPGKSSPACGRSRVPWFTLQVRRRKSPERGEGRENERSPCAFAGPRCELARGFDEMLAGFRLLLRPARDLAQSGCAHAQSWSRQVTVHHCGEWRARLSHQVHLLAWLASVRM